MGKKRTYHNYKSYAPNEPATHERTAKIDAILREAVEIGMGPLTSDAIARMCGMSKQNVFQIEQRAIRKLRWILRREIEEHKR